MCYAHLLIFPNSRILRLSLQSSTEKAGEEEMVYLSLQIEKI